MYLLINDYCLNMNQITMYKKSEDKGIVFWYQGNEHDTVFFKSEKRRDKAFDWVGARLGAENGWDEFKIK